MGKASVNAVEMALHGDSVQVFILEDGEDYKGKVRGIVSVYTNKLGQVEIVINGIKATVRDVL